MRPVIALTAACNYNQAAKQPTFLLNQNYFDAIAAAGGLPLMVCNTRLAADYAEMCDGLIITGGESTHPRYYGETFYSLADNDHVEQRELRAGCNPVRDEMEMALFREFSHRKKPVMGICRGHQLLNAAMGGVNYLNFPRKHPVEHMLTIHEIIAEPDSVLSNLYGERFLVNSYHRDCAKTPGPQVKVTARSIDGIIEAIEHETLPVYGFQFHPERMRGDTPNPAEGPSSDALFEFFVNKCIERAQL